MWDRKVGGGSVANRSGDRGALPAVGKTTLVESAAVQESALGADVAEQVEAQATAENEDAGLDSNGAGPRALANGAPQIASRQSSGPIPGRPKLCRPLPGSQLGDAPST